MNTVFSIFLSWLVLGYSAVGLSQHKKTFISSQPIPHSGILSLDTKLGVAHYTGDLSDGINFAHLGLGPALGIALLYRVHEHISLKADLNVYQVKAHQKHSRNATGNLSFRTRNPEFLLGGQFNLIAFTRESLFNPYLLLQAGFTYLTPKAKLNNEWYSLAPLMTEAVKYNRFPIVVNAGLGVHYRITDRWSVGVEIGNRFIQTDYLDDVSTTYPDPALLLNDLARQLSDRTPEIGLPAQQPGYIRGNPRQKDSYLFFNLSAQRVLWTKQMAKERKRLRCTQ